jgi:hypothetical protein
MKKTQIGLALFVVFAFGAITAASAFATSPEWLVKGNSFSGTLSSETTGLLTLIKLVSSTNSEVLNKLDCEGTFDGTITSPAGTDEA